MKNLTSIGAAVAAAVVATLLTAPSPADASGTAGWHLCPAIDTEPMCGLGRSPERPASDDRLRPTVVVLAPAQSDDAIADVSCSPRPLARLHACAG